MIALIVCGIFLSLAALLLVTRTLLGDNEETRELKARLRFHQIEPRQFTDQCLMELVEVATRDLRSSEFPMNRAVHAAIDQAAIEVRNIMFGYKYYSSAEIARNAASGNANPYWEKLAFFDPRHFAIDRLAQTQAAHSGRFLGDRSLRV